MCGLLYYITYYVITINTPYDLYTTVIFIACISACVSLIVIDRAIAVMIFTFSPMDVVLAHKPNPYHHDCDCTKLFTICKSIMLYLKNTVT